MNTEVFVKHKTNMANHIKSIAIKNLTFWDKNPRLPDKFFNQNETELIQYFLSKSDFKIKELIESIVKNFDLPQLEKIVVWNDGDRHIVLEGNRRLVAYKLLNNPTLAKDKKISNFIEIEKNKKEINISDDFSLECAIVDNIEDGFRYIDEKHYYGNNEVNWKDTERSNYSKTRGTATREELIKIGIAKIVRELDLPEEMQERVLGRGYVTTFYRIVAKTPAQREFEYSIDENKNLVIGDKEFSNKLKVIIYFLLNKKDFKGNTVDSRALNTDKEIEEFIKSIDSKDAKKVDEQIKVNTTENIFGDKTISIGPSTTTPKVLPKTIDRKTLIPRSCSLTIPESKINNIYHELRGGLLLDDTKNAVPNAVGVLFRVFLEICLDYYAKKNGNEFSKNHTISQKIPWVVNSLVTKGVDKGKFEFINKVGSSGGNTYLSIDNFHEYVHSITVQPTSGELKEKWNQLQIFFEILWPLQKANKP